MNENASGLPPDDQQDLQSRLKAQNDLLALKLLHEPEFMLRVPVLSPQAFEPTQQQDQAQGQDRAQSAHTDAALHALSEQVLQRVLEHLDQLLPDLIASTLEEVLRDWSRDQN